jgi:hypothetical protein
MGVHKCSYFSVFFLAEDTLVSQIFIGSQRAFPIATIRTWAAPQGSAKIPRSYYDNRTDACPNKEDEQQGTDKKRLHVKPTSYDNGRKLL